MLTDGALLHRMTESDKVRLFVVGHKHEPRWTTFGDRKLIQAGCLRNEYMLSDRAGALRPIPKSYVEVYLRGELPVVSHLVVFEGPAPPPGYLPASICDVVPGVRALLSGTQPAQLNRERAERRTRFSHSATAGRARTPRAVISTVGDRMLGVVAFVARG